MSRLRPSINLREMPRFQGPQHLREIPDSKVPSTNEACQGSDLSGVLCPNVSISQMPENDTPSARSIVEVFISPTKAEATGSKYSRMQNIIKQDKVMLLDVGLSSQGEGEVGNTLSTSS